MIHLSENKNSLCKTSFRNLFQCFERIFLDNFVIELFMMSNQMNIKEISGILNFKF